MRRITEEITVFPFISGFMNLYLIHTPDGLILVDTGTGAGMMRRALDQMQAAGHAPAGITRIIITHAHYDHCGGLAFLQTQINAQTCAHPRETAIIRGELPPIFADPRTLSPLWRAMLPNMKSSKTAPARVDVELREGDTLPGGWQVIELPGHAYGQIGLWQPEKRALIAGDMVMHLPFGLTLPLRPATPDMPEAKRSIQKAAALRPNVLCVGHGKPITKNTADTLNAFAAKHKV